MLKNLVAQPAKVTHDGESIDVHALRLTDLAGCFHRHAKDMMLFFESVVDDAEPEPPTTAQPADVAVPAANLSPQQRAQALIDAQPAREPEDEPAPSVTAGSGFKAMIEFAGRAPELVAELVVAAVREADNPDTLEESMQAARDIPIGVQVQILRKAWELNALDGDELGNFLSGLTTRLKSALRELGIGRDLLPSQPST